MGRYEREKGKRGEREARKLLAEIGYDFERTAQHSGKAADSSDLRPSKNGGETTELEYEHLRCEVKYGYPKVEIHHRTFREWAEHVFDEARRHGQTGFVLYRKPRRPWVIAYISPMSEALIVSPDVEAALDLLHQH